MKPFALPSIPTLTLLTLGALSLGCGAVSNDPVPVDVADDTMDSQGVLFPVAAGDLPSNSPETNPGLPPSGTAMPADFTPTELGGWKLGAAVTADAAQALVTPEDSRPDGCG